MAEARTVSHPSQDTGDTAPAPLQQERRCILLAEHDRINQQVITRLLVLLGHDVVTASTGRDALVRWRSGGVDLMLVDMKLPDLEAPAVARTVRLVEAAKGRSRTPIVTLGGEAPGTEPLCPPSGDIDGALAKPLQIKTLQAVLARCLAVSPRHAPVATPTSSSGEPPVVDLSVLHRLVGDDPAVVREILLDYLESAREQARELRRAYRKGDVRLVGGLAHKLKSASLAVGALLLGELCAEMELPAQSDFGTAELEHARFDRVFDAAIQQIETYLEKMPR
jgi:CheY-like chemotaxis protein/HPt (histidine-containing phosphotransfer) domain-containing protein